MKAKELMIGDWVFCEGQPAPSNATIETIDDEGVWFIGDKYEGSASLDRVFPIPITSEILEKNGFVRAEKFHTYHYQHGGVYISVGLWGRITISSEGKRFGNRMNIDCQYIHELQHALRLCGIDKEIVL